MIARILHSWCYIREVLQTGIFSRLTTIMSKLPKSHAYVLLGHDGHSRSCSEIPIYAYIEIVLMRRGMWIANPIAVPMDTCLTVVDTVYLLSLLLWQKYRKNIHAVSILTFSGIIDENVDDGPVVQSFQNDRRGQLLDPHQATVNTNVILITIFWWWLLYA